LTNTSNRAAFIKLDDPDVFIREDKIGSRITKSRWNKKRQKMIETSVPVRPRRPHMPHSVAVLIFSPYTNKIVLGQPVKAVENGAMHVFVPPQKRLQGRVAVKGVAEDVFTDVLRTRPNKSDLVYVGSSYGDHYHGDVLIRYGKMIHWVGIQLGADNGMLRRDSEKYQKLIWCGSEQLLESGNSMMSDRKYTMTLQAILASDHLVAADVKLAPAAGRRLKDVKAA